MLLAAVVMLAAVLLSGQAAMAMHSNFEIGQRWERVREMGDGAYG